VSEIGLRESTAKPLNYAAYQNKTTLYIITVPRQ
jgi:hypothetical protein